MTALRWVFQRRWHPEHRWYARWRAAWLIARGWETEICGLCGGRVGMVWHAPDELWRNASGYPTDGGVLCVSCFNRLAREASLHPYWEVAAHEFPSCSGSPCGHLESMMVIAGQRDALWRDGCDAHPDAPSPPEHVSAEATKVA